MKTIKIENIDSDYRKNLTCHIVVEPGKSIQVWGKNFLDRHRPMFIVLQEVAGEVKKLNNSVLDEMLEKAIGDSKVFTPSEALLSAIHDCISEYSNVNAEVIRDCIGAVRAGALILFANRHFDKTFKIGDQAEYDSYNMSYYGPIRSITSKSVIIWDELDQKNRRLKFSEFCRRNWDFDFACVKAKNAEESMCH